MAVTKNPDPLYTEAQALFEFSQSVRRDLHRHPEIGFLEVRTAGIVADELERLGFRVKSGFGQTGLTGRLSSDRGSRTILLRFDMDALPVEEQNQVEYASANRGVMHACGHDGHVAIGLTTARLLAERRNQLDGTVVLAFQPAEEGLGGAAAMIADGALEDPRPDACLALHLWNERPVGWAAVHPGPLMASSDLFEVTLHGTGGHGALPQDTIDPILAGAQLVGSLQSIVSRNVSPLKGAVVSVTQFQAGDAFNVIPPSARLRGTIRAFEPDVRALVMSRVEEIALSTAAAFRCRAEVKFLAPMPAVINDPATAGLVERAIKSVAPDMIIDRTYRTMVSEDMSEFFAVVPGCYLLLGSAPQPPETAFGHHHPRFNFDEQVLPLGAALLAKAALLYLQDEAHEERIT